jgi:hypothetical protein
VAELEPQGMPPLAQFEARRFDLISLSVWRDLID